MPDELRDVRVVLLAMAVSLGVAGYAIVRNARIEAARETGAAGTARARERSSLPGDPIAGRRDVAMQLQRNGRAQTPTLAVAAEGSEADTLAFTDPACGADYPARRLGPLVPRLKAIGFRQWSCAGTNGGRFGGSL